MGSGFDRSWAEQCIEQLGTRGVEFAEGLSKAEVGEIAATFGVEVPVELSLFLMAGVPTSPRWARWREGPEIVFEETRAWVERAFRFDIRENDYWHDLFGDRPSDDANAIAQALNFVNAAPPLIPVYSHRHLTTHPSPRPVLSVYQATDSIYYGYDLAAYFSKEFDLPLPRWATTERSSVPVWEDLFDL